MPSKKILEKKISRVNELAKKIEVTLVGILVDYKGINVVDDTSLRKELKSKNVSYRVVKNTLLKRAFESAKISGISGFLNGPTAIAIDGNDYSNAARILRDFSKKNEYFKIKAGFIEKEVVDLVQIIELAELPTKEVLVSKFLYALSLPLSNLCMTFKGIIRSFAIVINQIIVKMDSV